MGGKKDYSIMVTIRCVTYNQVNYIRKCLEGFVMQQTNFPFEAIVHDDASTDGTTEIVREFAEKYPTIIKPLYEEENQWSKHNGRITEVLYENTRGKYIAPCDGDDCWTDPLKLQKQVDFMECHEDYTLIHTGFNYIDMAGDIIPTPNIPLYKNLSDRIKNGYLWHYLLVHSSFILYSTTLFRASVFDKERMGIDHGTFLSCARQGKIHYFPDVTTSYRIDPNSFMRTRENKVIKYIRNAIFEQLFYFSSSRYNTIRFYKYNLNSRVAIAEGIISSVSHLSDIQDENKFYKIVYILFRRPFNLVMLPFALIKKMLRHFDFS